MPTTYSNNTQTKNISVPYPIEIDILKNGDGSAVLQLNLKTLTTCTINLVGDAHFYDTIDGNSGENTSRSLATGGDATYGRPFYIKCTTSAKLVFTSKRLEGVIKADGTGANKPLLGGNLSNVVTLVSFYMSSPYNDFWEFNVTKLVNLAYCVWSSAEGSIGKLGGDFSNNDKLINLILTNKIHNYGGALITGDLSNKPLVFIELASNGVSGDNFYGELPNTLEAVSVHYGEAHHSMTVTIDNLTNLVYFKSTNILITVTRLINLKALSYINLTHETKTSAQINQLLADMWANKDEAKSLNPDYRDILLAGTNQPPTGQGLTDKALLQNYRSPNNTAGPKQWNVLTN